MEDYKAQDVGLTKKSVILLNRILKGLQRLKIDRMDDYLLCKTIEHLIFELKKIRILINENPRFDYVLIQNEIDECFTKDKNATGVVIYLDWKDVEKGKENRISIYGKIGKAI